MVVSDTHVFPGFLPPILKQIFFPKPPTTFLIWFCRGEKWKYAWKKVCLDRGSNSQPPGHKPNHWVTWAVPEGEREWVLWQWPSLQQSLERIDQAVDSTQRSVWNSVCYWLTKFHKALTFSPCQAISLALHFLSLQCFIKPLSFSVVTVFNSVPDMPILCSSNSTANKDMMSKIWTNGDIVIWSSWKHCGKRRNCS